MDYEDMEYEIDNWEQEHEDELALLHEMENEDQPRFNKNGAQLHPPPKPNFQQDTSAVNHESGNDSNARKRAQNEDTEIDSGYKAPQRQEVSKRRKTADPFADSDDDDDDDYGNISQQAMTQSRLRIDRILGRHGSTSTGCTRIKPREPSITFLHPDGSKYYLKVNDTAKMKSKAAAMVDVSHSTGSLLGIPFHELKSISEKSMLERVMSEAKRTSSIQERIKQAENPDKEDDMLTDERDTELWVEKYAPKNYVDLVSEEQTNTKLLFWIKQWDNVVFKRNVTADPRVLREKLDEEIDDNMFSEFKSKVVLLSGPPGTGKTSLAHVVARHAGYNTIELNASDDRTADTLRERIINATEMQEVLTKDRRPNCLILDEIDGATKAAINVLVAMAKVEKKSGKGKRRVQPLKRPIICICNDVYAASLRPLRKIAMEIKMDSCPSLTRRLEDICKELNIKTDSRSLAAVCDMTNRDIRACIGLLQFTSSKTKIFNIDTLNTSLGRKDRKGTVASVFDRIFRRPRTSSRNTHVDSNKKINGSSSSVLDAIQNNGEFDKILEGCFENYTNLRGVGTFDPHLSKMNRVNEWTVFADVVNSHIQKTQNYALMAYSPYVGASFYHEYCTTEKQYLKHPKRFWEVQQQLVASSSTISTMLEDTSPNLRHMLSPNIVVLDLLSPLLEMLSPTIRPVAKPLLSTHERVTLQKVIETMDAYNITFKQVRVDSGYEYIFEPQIDQLAKFDAETRLTENKKPYYPNNLKASNMNMDDVSTTRREQREERLTYHAKQLISNEIAHFKMMKKYENSSEGPVADKQDKVTKTLAETQIQTPENKIEEQKKVKPDMVEFMKARMGIQLDGFKDIKKSSKPTKTRDFFGRVVTKKPAKEAPVVSKSPRKKASPLQKNARFWFKFQEGCTNAVRKPVRMRDII
eukprot:m.23738 g.23738  ORF g.23738 m.23738 type:complete len:922 (-) comp7536_c0_seq1:1909-4674(-)